MLDTTVLAFALK